MKTSSMMRIPLLALVVGFLSALAQAEEVTTWVEADGVVSFGNPQFAPRPAQMKAIEVGATYGMHVPDVSILAGRTPK